jgi:hypothetical protein
MCIRVTKPQAVKTYGGAEVYVHAFLTSALVGGEWLTSRAGRFIPGERTSDIHWTWGWVNPRAVLNAMVKAKFPFPCLESSPNFTVSSPYPSHYTDWVISAIGEWWNNDFSSPRLYGLPSYPVHLLYELLSPPPLVSVSELTAGRS